MARDENPPFSRGETFYNGGTIDTNDLGGENLEGKEYVFEDVNPTTGVARSSRPVRVRVVRNTAAIALLPKRVARFEAGANEYGSRIDGYATTTAAEGYPIDEYLPSAGVPVNDLCYIVVEGPAVVLTSLSDLSADVAVGAWMVAITGATSGATTSGRLRNIDLTGATQPLADMVLNRIGRALSAATTQNTNSNLLLHIGKW
jgi:hypothetical protein